MKKKKWKKPEIKEVEMENKVFLVSCPKTYNAACSENYGRAHLS